MKVAFIPVTKRNSSAEANIGFDETAAYLKRQARFKRPALLRTGGSGYPSKKQKEKSTCQKK